MGQRESSFADGNESYIRVRCKLGGGWIWQLMTAEGQAVNESKDFADRLECEADAKLQGLPVHGLSRRRKATRDTSWTISKDATSLWRWKRVDGNGIVSTTSDRAFLSKAECIRDARRHGYTGGS